MLRNLERHNSTALTRRSLLKAGAAVGGGLIIGWVPKAGAAIEDPNFAPNAFVRIDRAGKVTVISPMIEMGQGTYTSLPMLIAEELDVAMADVSVDHSPANAKLYGNPLVGGIQMTGGSTSIRAFYLPLRQAGAAARQMLVQAAAASLKVDTASLDNGGGICGAQASGNASAMVALVDEAAKLPVPENVKLKEPSEFRIIGTPAKRLDVSGKVNGTATYGIDVKLPDMKAATVSASPVFGGKVKTVDEVAALKVPGTHQVLKIENAVAVVGDHYWAARSGIEAAAIEFDDGPHAAVTTADIVADMAKAALPPVQWRARRATRKARSTRRRPRSRRSTRRLSWRTPRWSRSIAPCM